MSKCASVMRVDHSEIDAHVQDNEWYVIIRSPTWSSRWALLTAISCDTCDET